MTLFANTVDASHKDHQGKPLEVDGEFLKQIAVTRTEEPQKLEKNREKHAPNADLPTTASAQKGLKDLSAIAKQVDPSSLSSIMPQMHNMMGQVAAAMSGSSQSSRKEVIKDILTGALLILSEEFGVEHVLEILANALEDNAIRYVHEDYRSIVTDAIANIVELVAEHGVHNLPLHSYHTVLEIGDEPDPVVSNVPDLYVQQYYLFDQDPTPGYIDWISQDGDTTVYTLRTIGDPYYETPIEEITHTQETALATALHDYFEEENLTAKVLGELLEEFDLQTKEGLDDKSMGKNAGKNNGQLMQQLMGYMAPIVNKQKEEQLPPSVLDQNSIKDSLEKYSQNMSQLRNIKPKLKEAGQLRSPTNQILGNSSLMSSLPSSVSGIVSRITSNIGS